MAFSAIDFSNVINRSEKSFTAEST